MDTYYGMTETELAEFEHQSNLYVRGIIKAMRANTARTVSVAPNVTLYVTHQHITEFQVQRAVDTLRKLYTFAKPTDKVEVFLPWHNLPTNGGVTWRVDDKGKPSPTGKNRILAMSSVTLTTKMEDLESSMLMPVASNGRVSVLEYALTHEWGHVIDQRSRTDQENDKIESKLLFSAKADDPNSLFNRSLSGYGKSQEPEAYAEAFTQWALTAGSTTNYAANWYAREYKWNGYEQADRFLASHMLLNH